MKKKHIAWAVFTKDGGLAEFGFDYAGHSSIPVFSHKKDARIFAPSSIIKKVFITEA